MKRVDFRRACKFLTTGAASAFTYFFLFSLFYSWLHWHYQLAVSLAYFLAVLVHFFGNRRFTFQSHGQDLHKHVAKYVIMVGINYLLTLLVMKVIAGLLGFTPYLAVIVAFVATIGCSYFLMSAWVFAKKEDNK